MRKLSTITCYSTNNSLSFFILTIYIYIYLFDIRLRTFISISSLEISLFIYILCSNQCNWLFLNMQLKQNNFIQKHNNIIYANLSIDGKMYYIKVLVHKKSWYWDRNNILWLDWKIAFISFSQNCASFVSSLFDSIFHCCILVVYSKQHLNNTEKYRYFVLHLK